MKYGIIFRFYKLVSQTGKKGHQCGYFSWANGESKMLDCVSIRTRNLDGKKKNFYIFHFFYRFIFNVEFDWKSLKREKKVVVDSRNGDFGGISFATHRSVHICLNCVSSRFRILMTTNESIMLYCTQFRWFTKESIEVNKNNLPSLLKSQSEWNQNNANLFGQACEEYRINLKILSQFCFFHPSLSGSFSNQQ